MNSIINQFISELDELAKNKDYEGYQKLVKRYEDIVCKEFPNYANEKKVDGKAPPNPTVKLNNYKSQFSEPINPKINYEVLPEQKIRGEPLLEPPSLSAARRDQERLREPVPFRGDYQRKENYDPLMPRDYHESYMRMKNYLGTPAKMDIPTQPPNDWYPDTMYRRDLPAMYEVDPMWDTITKPPVKPQLNIDDRYLQEQIRSLGGVENTISKMELSLKENELKTYVASRNPAGPHHLGARALSGAEPYSFANELPTGPLIDPYSFPQPSRVYSGERVFSNQNYSETDYLPYLAPINIKGGLRSSSRDGR